MNWNLDMLLLLPLLILALPYYHLLYTLRRYCAEQCAESSQNAHCPHFLSAARLPIRQNTTMLSHLHQT